MIPISLSLKNFLSYGPDTQTISFEPYSLICLSGKNGHGKSALLDAMTWAVWGQARKIAGATRADESLLRLSAHDMLVVFEFISNKTRYQVKREFMRSSNKGFANVNFALLDESGKVVVLTGKTIRETQSIIEKTIGLDFETFVNSAFLRQGESGEFSKKSPRERKEILARILSLDQYETIKRGALEKAKHASHERELLLQIQEKRAAEKKEYGDIDEKFQKVCDNLDTLTKNEVLLKQQLTQTYHMISKIQSEHLYYKTEITKKKRLQEERVALLSQIQELRAEWKSIISTYSKTEKIEPLLQRKNEVVHIVLLQKELLDNKIKVEQTLAVLKEKQNYIIRKHELQNNVLKTQYAVESESLKSSIESIEEKIQTSIDECTFITKENEIHETRIKTLKENSTLTTKRNIECAFLIKHFEKRIALAHRIIEKTEQYRKINQDNQKKISFLCDIRCALCPLCKQELPDEKRKHLHESVEIEQQDIIRNLNRLNKLSLRLEPYPKLVNEYRKNATIIAHELDTIHSQINKYTVTQAQLEERKQKLLQHIGDLRTKREIFLQKQLILYNDFTSKQTVITDDPTYNDLTDSIVTTEMSIKIHEYNEKLHASACQELQQLENLIAKNAAEKINRTIFTIKERMKTIYTFLKKNNEEQRKYLGFADKFEALTHKLSFLTNNEHQYTAELSALQQKKERLLQEKGIIETQQAQMQLLCESYLQDEKRVKILEDNVTQYTTIAQITGRDGIQALLIEQSIPEIEYEANEILARLTNNQMQLFIESVKDLKSGKTKETLDIKISDTEGVRSYDLFSGGEAFRIDLALRIGISKLLANRAGTALETLIVDEGFGSQDDEGVTLVLESFYKIQDDFKKIIIVSHLNNIKDQIPVHFVVTKQINGSTVRVMSS